MTEEIQKNITKCIAIVLAMDNQDNQKYYIKQCVNRYIKDVNITINVFKNYNTYTSGTSNLI